MVISRIRLLLRIVRGLKLDEIGMQSLYHLFHTAWDSMCWSDTNVFPILKLGEPSVKPEVSQEDIVIQTVMRR